MDYKTQAKQNGGLIMIYYGADYYPEQETREDILADAKRLKAQGFNVVRIAEFAWATLEPEEGRYNMEWLTDVIDILGQEGVKCIVCTPSACPPIWMIEKYPDILYMDGRGVVRPFGGRRHYCPNNERYLEYSRKIAEKMAVTLKGNPNVVGWHIDNELAQEATGRCHCPTCTAKFHKWLENRYGTIEEFNRRAGTVFWSQTYQRFDQVNPPIKSIEPDSQEPLAVFRDNPTVRLDFERFSSDSFVDFLNNQIEVIRKHSDLPITTNTTGFWTNGVNYYDAFKNMDVAAVDQYLGLRNNSAVGSSTTYAFTRGIRGDQKFWVVETTASGGQGVWGACGWPQGFPGELQLQAIHAMVQGAELFTYFQYKQFRFGAEQLETAVMDVDMVERRKNREMRETSGKLGALEDILRGTSMKNEIAICYDYDCLWATQIKPFALGYDYRGEIYNMHRNIKAMGYDADIVPMTDVIKQYKVVIIAGAIVLSDEFKQTLREYTEAGGTLVCGYLTGIKGIDNTARRESSPQGLTDVFGMRVDEVEPVYEDLSVTMKVDINGFSAEFKGTKWTESLDLKTAAPIMTYEEGFRKGEVAASINEFGSGKAIYLGTLPEGKLQGELFSAIFELAGVEGAPFDIPEGVEVVKRVSDNGDAPLYFVVNSNEKTATVRISDSIGSSMKIQDVSTVGTPGEVIEAGSSIEMPAKSYVFIK